MKLYITPDDPDIQTAVDDILSGYWRWAYSDFEALREWVVWHLSYVSDQTVHGQNEYWQLPSETLSLGTGDCEDFAILLCTLLRAYGVPADEVYVGGGWPDGHAFLFEHWYEGQWRAVEPQASVWLELLVGDLDISGYDTFWSFNDQECFEGKPALPMGVYEFEVGYSWWPIDRGASVEFECYLSAGQHVTGSVEWHGSSAIVYEWSLNVYDPNGDVLLTWSGTSLSHDFSFTASQAGVYEVEILKRTYMPRVARMEINPPDWTQN